MGSAAVHTLSSPDELAELLRIDFSAEQKKAITAPLEPAVIIAGAGSGKTTVMAARVVWLVGTGQVRPDQVLGLTFTRKAAAELSSRITGALLGAQIMEAEDVDEAGEQVVLTYDAFASRLVADHGLRIGEDGLTLMLAGAARYGVADQVVAQAPGEYPELAARWRPAEVVERVLALDSALSGHLCEPGAVIRFQQQFAEQLVGAPLYRGAPYKAISDAISTLQARAELLDLVGRYRDRKRELGVAEFGDQMALAARLVQQVPDVGRLLRDQFRIVLLDEYQDTSSAQASLLRGLFGGDTPGQGRGHPVTAVGDPFQAIYGWRGAASSNILQFASSFPCPDGSPARRYNLSINRRSGTSILQVANQLAEPLRSDGRLLAREPSELSADPRLKAPIGTGAGLVRAGVFATWPDEVTWIADDVVNAHRQGRVENWSDIAVLVRRSMDSGPLYQALADRDVPVEIVGLGGLLELPEIAMIVAVLRLLDDVNDNPATVELLTSPRWHLGAGDLAALGKRAHGLARSSGEGPVVGQLSHDPPSREMADDLADVLTRLDLAAGECLLDAVAEPGDAQLSGEGRRRVRELDQLLRSLRRHAQEPVPDLVRRIVAELDVAVEVQADPTLWQARRIDQLAAFLDAVLAYAQTPQASLHGLVAWLNDEREHGVGLDQATPSAANSVKLLTIHRAKGLEWELVYLPDLVQSVFPNDRVSDNWINHPEALPAPLRGDAADYPRLAEATKQGIEDYAKEGLKDEQRRAEERLAYVAATRARRELTATASWWRPGNRRLHALSDFFGVFQDVALADGQLVSQADEPLEAPAVEAPGAPWPVDDETGQRAQLQSLAQVVRAAAAEQPPAGQSVSTASSRPVLSRDDGLLEQAVGELDMLSLDEQAVLTTWRAEAHMLLAEAREQVEPLQRVAAPPSLTATGVVAAAHDPDGFAADLLRPMPRPVGRAASVGSRFHEWVEHRFGLASLLPEDAEELITPTRGTAQDAALRRLCAAFLAGPYAERVPHLIEAPFVLVIGGQQIRGRIDAVYAVDGGRYAWQVVDWKTSETPADPLQLAIYRAAWADITGASETQVDAVFYHVLSGQIQRPAGLPGRESLARMLDRLMRSGRPTG